MVAPVHSHLLLEGVTRLAVSAKASLLQVLVGHLGILRILTAIWLEEKHISNLLPVGFTDTISSHIDRVSSVVPVLVSVPSVHIQGSDVI